MQEIIVLAIATIALIYLVIKFIVKKKSQDCDKCRLNEPKHNKNHS